MVAFFVVDVPRMDCRGRRYKRVDEWMTITSFCVEGVREWLSRLGGGTSSTE